MNFYDREDCINISPYTDEYGTKSGVFVFKNFISQNLIERIEKQLPEFNIDTFTYEKTLIDWYANKVSPAIDGIVEVWEEISELLAPTWVIHPASNLLTVKPGDNGMFVHSDSPGKKQCHLLSQPDVWSTCCELDYGVVAYFGDFTGGEVFYPNIREDGTLKGPEELGIDGPCLEYQPSKGDLVIHSAFNPYGHGVREVTSGIRYAFSNFCLKAVDNPGTFYNYGTPEYYNQIGNRTIPEITNWMEPLRPNPQFSDEKILEMQASGLKGEELSAAFFSDMKE
jgi:hypothetical protein